MDPEPYATGSDEPERDAPGSNASRPNGSERDGPEPYVPAPDASKPYGT